MNESTPSGAEATRAADPSSSPIDTIIVAPELFEAYEPAVTIRRADDGTWRPVGAASQPAASSDGASTRRAKHLSDSKTTAVQASPTSRYAFEERTARIVRRGFHATATTILGLVVLGAVLLGATTWVLAPESRAASRSLVPPRATLALAPAASPSPRAAKAAAPIVEPLAIGAPTALRPKLTVTDVDVIWGRSERPIRNLYAAFKRSSERVGACLSRTAAATSDAPATLAVSMRIRSSGSVMWARPTAGSEGIRPAIPCIAEALRATPFPTSEDGLRVDAKLVFRGQ